jgi:hypothetical protein
MGPLPAPGRVVRRCVVSAGLTGHTVSPACRAPLRDRLTYSSVLIGITQQPLLFS